MLSTKVLRVARGHGPVSCRSWAVVVVGPPAAPATCTEVAWSVAGRSAQLPYKCKASAQANAPAAVHSRGVGSSVVDDSATTLVGMSISQPRPPSLEFRVFRGSDAVRARLLTEDQLHGRCWQHVRYDVYSDARLERDHGLACRAAITGLPRRATIAGPSAAFLWGVEHAAGPNDDVHLIAPPDARISPRRGVRVHAVGLDADERVDGAPARTSPLRTAWDLAGWLPPLAAVPIIDSLLAMQLVNPVELSDLVAARVGKRGWRRSAKAFGLADARAQSVPESRVRALRVSRTAASGRATGRSCRRWRRTASRPGVGRVSGRRRIRRSVARHGRADASRPTPAESPGRGWMACATRDVRSAEPRLRRRPARGQSGAVVARMARLGALGLEARRATRCAGRRGAPGDEVR
jgi:hypothetical protein